MSALAPGPTAPHADAAPPHLWLQDVGDGHRMAVREWGAPDGLPVLLLHGGPGSGATPFLWRAFDPTRFRVIVPDQRGAGASQPPGATHANTLAHLLADLRALRLALALPGWLVAGGSWGATLALAHALDQPGAVRGLALRAVFLARASDIAGFFSPGDDAGTPEWRALRDATGGTEGAAAPAVLAQALASPAADDAAAAWWRWEQRRAGHPGAQPPDGPADRAARLQRYRVQAHLLAAGCGLADDPLLPRVGALAGRPVEFVLGDADRICPPEGATALHAALPGSRLTRVAGAGHDPTHPGLVTAWRDALDRLHATLAPAGRAAP